MQSGAVALNGLVIELETGSYNRRGYHYILSEAMWQRKFNAIGSQKRELHGTTWQGKGVYIE